MASPLSRRRFLAAGSALAAAPLLARPALAAPEARSGAPAPLHPPRLNPGDTVALIAPAGAVRPRLLDEAKRSMEMLGLKYTVGRHVLDRHGYLAGTDAARAEDFNRAITDPNVDALFAIRGGWGCARMLPFVDWTALRENPKAVIGYSDLTSLLMAAYARSGVVGFHGPVATSTFSPFTLASLRALVFDAEAGPLAPLAQDDPEPIVTLTAGTARGRLVGGNLTVLCAMVGTPYMPSFEGEILFLEDIGESVYRIDRMLTQLGQAGLLGGLAGVAFGSCRGCLPEVDAVGQFTLEEVMRRHFEPLAVPTYLGAPIGHITDKVTVPVGALAEIDADRGTLSLLEPAVR
ncbi:S66 peptidase family protein [Rubricoccus marinus]|uniref:LD-carboxypeptidase n=1 Tax=Rubricoccus marinus TaxID=716817 RepID=A0A259TYE2_9BACT|nr:LD-carboxypeptidase [Rubricoccus marinus]OZC02793.1 hypothetical protein BSZ36_07285 [Rubricoccus marinus]